MFIPSPEYQKYRANLSNNRVEIHFHVTEKCNRTLYGDKSKQILQTA